MAEPIPWDEDDAREPAGARHLVAHETAGPDGELDDEAGAGLEPPPDVAPCGAAARVASMAATDEPGLACLVARVVYQDEAAFAELYRHLAGRVFAQVVRVTRDIGSAEEVVEDVFWQVWRQAPRFDAARGTVSAWVRRIARSRALDALRAQASNPLRQAAAVDDEALGLQSEHDDHDPLRCLAGARSAVELERALAALDPLRRQLVSLAFLRGCSQVEIAEQTGLPLGTVKSHIRRALVAMKAALEGAEGAAPLTRGRA